MEERIFPLPAVAGELRNMVEARLHTDGVRNIERIKELQKSFTGSVANPIYVVVDPKTGKKLRLRAGFTSAEKFAAFLRG
jgi:hypothetical protein